MPPNNTPVYSVLGLPLLKYISHIPMAPFNTEKCKGRLALPFLATARREIHNDPLRNYLGFGGGGGCVCVWGGVGVAREYVCVGGGGQCLYCLISIGSHCRISVAVLVNNCLLWRNSTKRGINRY